MTTYSEQLAYDMLTENTGTNMLDSGGENGRAWQRNQELSIEDFKKQPRAKLHIGGVGYIYDKANLFHVISEWKHDNLTEQFNDIDESEDSDYMGIGQEHLEFMERNNLEFVGDVWNTCNWENNLSQVVQGYDVYDTNDDKTYMLVCVHGGADVRAGYTYGKLFYTGDYETNSRYCISPITSFEVKLTDAADIAENKGRDFVSMENHFDDRINHDRTSITPTELALLVKASGYVDDSVEIEGDFYIME